MNYTVILIALLLVLLTGIMIGLVIGRLSFGSRARQYQGKKRTVTKKNDSERFRIIYQIVSALSATLNYQRVLETALDMAAQAFTTLGDQPGNLVSAFLLYQEDDNNPERMVLGVGSARGFTAADLRVKLPGKEGLLGKVIEEGEAQIDDKIAKDVELSRVIALQKCALVYCVPLRAELHTYGVLLFAHLDRRGFTPERLEVLDIISHQVMIALQNAKLYNDLEEEKERIMRIQEDARNQLARDLHDGPTQSVAAIAMRVNYTRRLLEKEPASVPDELLKIEDLARRTTKEIRHMLFTLRPLMLESQGLVSALQAMADKMQETYGQNVVVEVDQAVVDQLELGKQTVIFYIAEEAVNNARKHAQAEQIKVRLKPVQPGLALLEIQDNGLGFDVNTVNHGYNHRDSLGLINMRERAELVNGMLHIDSAVGRGTRVQVAIPLNEEMADRLRNRKI